MPKVSVIIPIYNVEKYIGRCAKALFEQTLDDIEYIFVNDSTPDNSMSILREVIKSYPHRERQIIITSHEINQGLPTARKTGISLATGDYIIHCDSDDWPENNMYELLYKKAILDDCDIVYSDFYITTPQDRIRVKKNNEPKLMLGPIWNKLFRRSLCQNNYIIYPTDNKAEDGTLVMQYCYYAAKYAYVNLPLYNYYYNNESMTRLNTKESKIKSLNQEIKNTKIRIEFLKYHNDEQKYEKDIAIWKYLCRGNILSEVTNQNFYRLWRNTFPEIDDKYYICKYLRGRNIIKYLIIRWHLYKLFYKFRS